MVRDNFIQFEAEEILSIPFASLPIKDMLVWGYEKSGNYSIKSGYHFIIFYRSLDDEHTGSSNVSVF